MSGARAIESELVADAAASKEGAPGESVQHYMCTEFLERLAHEMRGPTGVTLGALDELELALGPDAERLRTLLNMARRGARKVLRTADRLSRTAQIEGGQFELNPLPADLAALLKRTCAEAEGVEGRRAVTVALNIPDGECSALLDASWAQVALFELVTQALRSARKRVDISLVRDGGAYRVSASDDGVGIRPLASTRFVTQADRRDTGLAMPLALDIARAHGGDLRIEEGSNGQPVHVMIFAAH